MNNISIILGLGMGDEGKGAFVNYLCSKSENSLVVRFNGGHQVGHTVVVGDKRHVFSNFGSGTLLNTPTYWSEYCTVNPMGVLKEGNVLRGFGLNPQLIFNANAMITTPFDTLRNLKLDDGHNHGTVGVGFGTTIQRNDDHYHLYVRDLKYPAIRDAKIKLLQEKYYGYVSPDNSRTKMVIDEFKVACDDMIYRFNVVDNLNQLLDKKLIFEGGQGIMLDTDYGFFPHVTRSNTTSKNAMEIINKLGITVDKNSVRTYYVTRAYQTRHGNGPMTNEGMDISYIKENPLETNINGGFQGDFRKSPLDLDMLKYAFECDRYHNPLSRKNIVITCLDQVPEAIPATIRGDLGTVNFKEIGKYCGINFKFPCFSDTGYQFTCDNY
jgi:adenylosuccinate synthase